MPVERARRFDIQTRVLYRTAGSNDWAEGTSVNVSRSGILFASDGPLPRDTPIDLVLWLSPDAVYDCRNADVVCSGHVVRAEAGGPAAPFRLAAAIASYQLAHPSFDSPR